MADITRSIVELQEKYHAALRQAGRANGNLRLRAKYLTEAASAQYELSKLTRGSSSDDHVNECSRLLQEANQIKEQLGMQDTPAPQSQPAPAVPVPPVQPAPVPVSAPAPVQPAPQKAQENNVQGSSTEGLDVEGFSPESIQMKEPGNVSFDGLIGMDHAVSVVTTFFKNRHNMKTYTHLAAQMPKDAMVMDIMLYGPPGTGKTYFMKAIGNYVLKTVPNSAFFILPPDVLRTKHVGVSGDRLTSIFREMEKYENPVLCIDEIDALGASRDGANQGQYVTDLVTQLLQLIDGVKGKSDVLLIGGTNFPWNVDPAIISRMTERVYIGLPTKEAVTGYLTKGLKPFVSKEAGVLEKVASDVAGMLEHVTMRDLSTLINRVSNESFFTTTQAYPDNPEIAEFIPLEPERIRLYASKIVTVYDPEYNDRLVHPEKW